MDNKLIDKLIEQQEQIKAMQENEESAIKVMDMYKECKKRINKAIEYIIKEGYNVSNNILLDILKGEYINE